MPSETTSIRVNFSRPFALFPLEGVVLLPHALLRLFIFEPRYRQMVEHALDSSGQIAMAVFKGESWKHDYHGNPPIRGAVCVGHIAQHEKLADGNYRIWLHGVCRARVKHESPPEGERLYREAMLEPIGTEEAPESELQMVRADLVELLRTPPLRDVAPVAQVLEQIEEQEEVPTSALLEVVALSVMPMLDDPKLQYRLLEEGNVFSRASILTQELSRIGSILRRADRQFDPEAPKGVSWN